MTYSPAKVAAYAQLEDAIDVLRGVYEAEDGDVPNVLTGWVLLTSSIEFHPPRPDDPTHDDLDQTPVNGWYSRRGQNPTLSYGIVHEAIRHYDAIQEAEGTD